MPTLVFEDQPNQILDGGAGAHFTSAGQHVLAQLYQGAYQVLASDD